MKKTTEEYTGEVCERNVSRRHACKFCGNTHTIIRQEAANCWSVQCKECGAAAGPYWSKRQAKLGWRRDISIEGLEKENDEEADCSTNREERRN